MIGSIITAGLGVASAAWRLVTRGFGIGAPAPTVPTASVGGAIETGRGRRRPRYQPIEFGPERVRIFGYGSIEAEVQIVGFGRTGVAGRGGIDATAGFTGSGRLVFAGWGQAAAEMETGGVAALVFRGRGEVALETHAFGAGHVDNTIPEEDEELLAIFAKEGII